MKTPKKTILGYAVKHPFIPNLYMRPGTFFWGTRYLWPTRAGAVNAVSGRRLLDLLIVRVVRKSRTGK